jgi:hypothetical protein
MMKKMSKMSVTTVVCSMAYGQSQVGSDACFPFTGKSGISVDLEDPSNHLEYSEVFCTPEIAEIIARETNRYAQNLLETLLTNKDLGSITGRK